MAIDEVLLFFLLSFWLAGTLLLSAGIFTGLQLLQLKRRGTTSPGNVAEGVTTTQGRVDPAEDEGSVTSPITGTEAVCYEFVVQRQAGTQPRTDWDTVEGGRDGVRFLLSDEAGSVLIDPTEANLEFDPDDVIEFEAVPEEIEAAANTLETAAVDEARDLVDIGVAELELGETYRILERRVQQGDSITATGHATADTAGDLGLTGPKAVLGVSADRSRLQRLLGVPFTLTDETETKATTTLMNRAIVLVTFGTPLFVMPVMFLFPPTG